MYICKFYCFPQFEGGNRTRPGSELNKRLALKRVYGLPNCFHVDVHDAAKLTRSAVLGIHSQSKGALLKIVGHSESILEYSNIALVFTTGQIETA